MPESGNGPVVVLVQSRKGGVGKTSIALSAAIQLAAEGKRVAFVELDTLGSHLAQVLPTDRDFEETPDGYQFNPGAFSRSGSDKNRPRAPEYRERPNYAWYFPLERRGYRRPSFEDIETHLVIGAEVKQAFGDGSSLETIQRHLGLFLAPSYLAEVSVLNDLQLSKEGQRQFREFLTKFVAQLAEHEYQYVVVDNSPGISFLAANVLAWALEWVRDRDRETCHLWYVNTPAWWDMGLTLYESNVYGHLLEISRPAFVVNRARAPWLGISALEPGRRIELGTEQRRLANEIVAQSLFLPLWQASLVRGARKQMAEKFLPLTSAVAILSHDEGVRLSMLRQEDEPESAPDEHAGQSPIEFSQQHAQAVLTRLANKFLTGFLVPAAAGTAQEGRFHRDVRTALLAALPIPS
jgi:cellulose biosynthesis protein BcsQ